MLNASNSDTRISSTLEQLKSRNEGALVTYLTGGDPSPEAFVANASALIEGGTDMVEIGIPFSDPIADGPVIQTASQRALTRGITPAKVLSLVGELSAQNDLPFVILTYYNPILAMGVERFLRTAKKSGVDGIVVPDAPAQADQLFQKQVLKHGVDRILLAAPNTSKSRLGQIATGTSGFLYLVSLYGVTGPRTALAEDISTSVRRIRSVNPKRVPVLAGFGVSTPNHVKSLMNVGVDGAIVGSALVRITLDHEDDADKVQRLLRERVAELKAATKKS